ncbi:MAG: hypothetical protein GY861_19965 [bacterium]|nr:hypothetical protein [bacterium]
MSYRRSVSYGSNERSSSSYAVADALGESAIGVSSSSNYQLSAGYIGMVQSLYTGEDAATVDISVELQGSRPVASQWEIPLTVFETTAFTLDITHIDV